MVNYNKDIACNVNNCKFNHDGCNCTLEKITVGCTCSGNPCTCCESFKEKV